RTPSSSLLCARGFLSANFARGFNGTSALTAAASATNAAEAEEITQHLAPGPRALPQSQTKGLCLGSSPLSLSLHRRIWLRPLTVKLNGRAEAPDGRRGRILSSSARGAQPPTRHGPFQRLLDVEPDDVTQLSVEWRLPAMANSQDRSVTRRYFGIATPPRHPGGSEPSTVHTPSLRVARYGFSESICFLP